MHRPNFFIFLPVFAYIIRKTTSIYYWMNKFDCLGASFIQIVLLNDWLFDFYSISNITEIVTLARVFNFENELNTYTARGIIHVLKVVYAQYDQF